MAKIKAGNIFYENGESEDATWEWSENSTVDIVTHDGYLILRIDPDDLIAVANAVMCSQFNQAYKSGLKLNGLSE